MKRSLALLLILSACSAPASRIAAPRPTTPAPTSAASSSPASAPSTPTPDLGWRSSAGAPDLLVVNNDGRIEVRDALGRFVRTLVARSHTGRVPLFLGLTLSPDRKTLYFVRHTSDSCTEIVKVPVAGGSLRVVARGGSISVSPDGRYLAYSDNFNCGSRRSRAVVRDLSNGTERSWRDTSELGGGGVAWMPDGRHLIFESCGADSCGPRLIDTRTMTMTTDQPYRLPAFIDHMNAFVSLPVQRGTLGSVALHVSYSSEDGTEPHPILEYTFATHETRELFAHGRNVRSVAFDRTGYHLLYATADRQLFHYDGARVVRLGTGISGAVW